MANDPDAIKQIADQMVAGWNAGDAVRFAASFSEDAIFIDVLGNFYRGRQTIETGHRHILGTIYHGSTNHYHIETIQFIEPSVAIAVIRQTLASRLSTSIDDPNRSTSSSGLMSDQHSRPMMILHKTSGQWQIVAFQNTRIAQPDPA